MMKLIIEIPEENYERMLAMGKMGALNNPYLMTIAQGTPLPKCKDCKHFEYGDRVMLNETPLIVAHEICNKWGNGCKSREDGYCFLFEGKEE